MKKALFALALPVLCFGFEEKPWYPCFMEFQFLASYDYNFFCEVDDAQPPLNSTYQTHDLSLGLELTAPETWNWQVELELADVTDVSFRYRSFAIQIRKLWLDDVAGDPVSLSTGIAYRDAGSSMRRALSTPYHGRANFELHTATGREWSCGPYWYFHTWGLVAFGQATSGSPWFRGDLYLGFNMQDIHRFRLYAKSYWGLGDRSIVELNDFNGWGNIGHQSIDIGASYRYQFSCYGSLRFDYMHRVYARSYPEHVNFFIFTFDFPFSVL